MKAIRGGYRIAFSFVPTHDRLPPWRAMMRGGRRRSSFFPIMNTTILNEGLSLAMEWGPRVRVNAVDVGLCRTEQSDDHYGGDERVAAIERTIPLGRMADPLEVGRVAAFLASDLASYVSGARVSCDGGGEPPVFLHID